MVITSDTNRIANILPGLMNSTTYLDYDYDEEEAVPSSATLFNTSNIIAVPVPAILANSTNAIPIHAPLTLHGHVLITGLYFLGVLGNVTALALLFGSKSAPRNPRLSLMLRCLAVNDLTAVLGMWIQMILKSHIHGMANSHWYCSFRVIWRSFGLGSGCIVCVMAIDRWIALSNPFFYHRHVTIGTIRKGILSLWLIDLFIVCLPFFGFGSYYDGIKSTCVRYKLAEHPIDRAYAFVYLTFGILLCGCLVMCNMAVVRVLLSPINTTRRPSAVLVRRISRNKDLTFTASTSEELAFAKVMGLLCLVFVLCWLPQLFTVPVAQMYPKSPRCHFYLKMADAILALHFVVDPYFYVLQRWSWFKNLCRKHTDSRGNSVKTSNELCSL